jgi:phosphopantetheinyl transferase (holo-ACP synthase)
MGTANRAVETATVRTIEGAGIDAAKATTSIKEAQAKALEADLSSSLTFSEFKNNYVFATVNSTTNKSTSSDIYYGKYFIETPQITSGVTLGQNVLTKRYALVSPTSIGSNALENLGIIAGDVIEVVNPNSQNNSIRYTVISSTKLNDKTVMELNQSAISENLTGSPSIVNLYIESNNTSENLVANIPDTVLDTCLINGVQINNSTKYQCDLRGGVFLSTVNSASFPSNTLRGTSLPPGTIPVALPDSCDTLRRKIDAIFEKFCDHLFGNAGHQNGGPLIPNCMAINFDLMQKTLEDMRETQRRRNEEKPGSYELMTDAEIAIACYKYSIEECVIKAVNTTTVPHQTWQQTLRGAIKMLWDYRLKCPDLASSLYVAKPDGINSPRSACLRVIDAEYFKMNNEGLLSQPPLRDGKPIIPYPANTDPM